MFLKTIIQGEVTIITITNIIRCDSQVAIASIYIIHNKLIA